MSQYEEEILKRFEKDAEMLIRKWELGL